MDVSQNVPHSAKIRLSSKPWAWMGQCRNQAGQVLVLVLLVALWMTLKRLLGVSVTDSPSVHRGLLLRRAWKKQRFSNSGIIISFFNIHRKALVSDKRQIHK